MKFLIALTFAGLLALVMSESCTHLSDCVVTNCRDVAHEVACIDQSCSCRHKTTGQVTSVCQTSNDCSHVIDCHHGRKEHCVDGNCRCLDLGH